MRFTPPRALVGALRKVKVNPAGAALETVTTGGYPTGPNGGETVMMNARRIATRVGPDAHDHQGSRRVDSDAIPTVQAGENIHIAAGLG